MANLIEYIQSQVYENSTEDISGSIMQQVLTRMASDEGVVNVHTISGQTPFADYNNAQAARDAVPAGFKKLGLIITYKLSSGWYIDEFIGSATSGWSTASNWKCLGPISVSQNASTGKTTITIGSESFDVATQPVSVSQNSQTGGHNLIIGGTKVASLDNIFNVNLYNDKSEPYASSGYARIGVPENMRVDGLVIAYLLSDGWHMEIKKASTGEHYYDDENWRPIVPAINSFESDNSFSPLAASKGKELLRLSVVDVSWINRSGETLATYANLDNALAAIPSYFRFRGMNIRFIDSTKQKYVQYRLVKDTYSNLATDWQSMGDEQVDINSIGLIQNNAIAREVQVKKPVAKIKNLVGVEIIQGLITQQNVWNYIQKNYESFVVKVKGGDVIKVVASDSYPCDIAFLKNLTDNYSNGDTPDFSTVSGYTTRIRVTAQTTQSFVVPDDSKFLVVTRLVDYENHSPNDIEINDYSISNDIRSIIDVPVKIYKMQSGFISGQNKWGTTSNKCIVFAIKPNANIQITAGADYPADIAFLKSIPATYVEGDTPDFSTETGYTARIRVTANTTQSFEVPSDANYLLINAVVSNDSILPSAISFNGYDAYRSVRDSVSLLLSSKNNSTDERTIENNAAKAYLNTILYDNEDYTYSFIDDYDTIVTPYRKDQPFPTVIELPDIQGISVIEIGDNFGFSENISVSDETSIDVYNLIPNREYFAKAKDSSDNVLASFRFVPKGELRMIKCDSLINIRDIGGWENLDGNKIKYGKIIRGCTMEGDYPISETDKGILLDVVGINAELDLRTDAEAGYATESVLGSSVSYVRIDPPRWDDFTSATITSAVSKAVTMFRQVLSFLSDGKTIYTHCKGGADRTGCVIMILEAVSGISESSMLKDYELTSFSSYGERERDDTSADYPMHYCLPYIKANYQGSTLSEKWIALLKSGGVTDTEITTFRELMLK